jgi:hypothetical protein
MDRTRSKSPQRGPMLGRRIAFMPGKSIVRKIPVQGDHCMIPIYLGKNGRS